jgi:hypothetical protein
MASGETRHHRCRAHPNTKTAHTSIQHCINRRQIVLHLLLHTEIEFSPEHSRENHRTEPLTSIPGRTSRLFTIYSQCCLTCRNRPQNWSSTCSAYIFSAFTPQLAVSSHFSTVKGCNRFQFNARYISQTTTNSPHCEKGCKASVQQSP